MMVKDGCFARSHLHAGEVLSAEVDAAELVAELVRRNVLRLSRLRAFGWDKR